MDDTTTLTKIIYWYANNKRRFFTLVVGGFVLLAGAIFFANNAFVFVDVSANFSPNNVTVYVASIGPTKKVGGVGLVIVPRNTTSLIVASGEYIKTETKIDIPWYGITSKTIPLRQDMDATKVAFKSTVGVTCATYSSTHNRLAYFNCVDPKSLVVYKTPTTGSWHSESLAVLYYPSTPVKSYLGGIIGISSGFSETTDSNTISNLTFVSDSGKVSTYITPLGTITEDLIGAQVFTNTYNPEDGRFIIVTQSGDIYIGTPENGQQVKYHHIQPPQSYSSDYNQTLCAFGGDLVYCYQGRAAYGDVSKDFDFSKYAGSQIITYSFVSDSETTSKISTDLYSLNDFQATASGELYATHHKQLYRFDRQGDIYNAVTISQNADAISGGDKLYFVQNKGIYAVDDKDKYTSYQVFYSPNVVAKSIYATDGKVFIVGSISTDKKTTYAYQLENTTNNSPGKRLIDVFPAAPDKFYDAISNDLVGDRLYFTLRLTPYRSDLNRTPAVDAGDVAFRKDNILSTLKLFNVPIEEQNIQFSY